MTSTLRNSIFVAIAIVACLLAAGVWVWVASTREVVTAVTPLSRTGDAGRALLVYHPGLSDFPDRITSAFAGGLAAAGWRVDRTTASRQTPTDLSAYDLLVLASPVYANAAAPPVTHYLERLGPLAGKPVALVFTAAGDAGPALRTSQAQVASQQGRVIGQYGYLTRQPDAAAQPTAAGSVADRAAAMARSAGQSLSLRPS